MEMGVNIAVHSNNHLKDLLEQSASDIDRYGKEGEDYGRRGVVFPPNGSISRSSKNIDVLKMGEDSNLDWEWHEEDYKGNNIRFINQVESQRIYAIEDTETKIMPENNEDLDCCNEAGTMGKELHGDEQQQTIASNYFDNANIIDSLDVSNQLHGFESIWDETIENAMQSSGIPRFINDTMDALSENEENTQFEPTNEKQIENSQQQLNSRKLKASFKYKEAEPRFIVRNKHELGKRTQQSYSQKFLERKLDGNSSQFKLYAVKEGRGHAKTNDINCANSMMYDQYIKSAQQSELISVDNNDIVTGKIFDVNRTYNEDQPVEDWRDHTANMDIPILEEMIRKEEETLRNHAFDISLTEGINSNPAERVHDEISQRKVLPKSDATLTPKRGTGVPNQAIEHSTKVQTYAQLHSLANDKYTCKQPESPLSYVSQHIEKKKKQISYKKYPLKDYAELNKEIVLQRSLGPDRLSEEYLLKKARADRLKEYALAVSMQNKEKMVVKKARSAPAPMIKERLNESKRAAALEYAEGVKIANLSRKSSSKWSAIKQRPLSEKTRGASAVEIMKERHEAEKLAVEKMRQNLASIIKDVKS